MKKFLSALSVCLLFSALPGAVPDPPNMPKRAPKIFKTGKTCLTLDARNALVVVAPGAPKTVLFAASELADLLGQVLKTKIRIADAPESGKVNIFLGFNRWSAKAGIDPARHHRDSYTIRIGQEGVFIAGPDDKTAVPARALKGGIWGMMYERATLFGVYAFLERFAGCRFYFPGKLGTVVPERKSIALPETLIFNYPDFIVRRVSHYQGSWPGAGTGADDKRAFWPEKNLAHMRLGMETAYTPCCHGLSRLGYIYRFADSHPEYFALMTNGRRHNRLSLPHPGALCYSSGIREEIYQDVKSFLSGEKASVRGVRTRTGGPGWDPSGFQPGYADVMPQDSYYRCCCDKCRNVFGDGPNYATEFMWTFVAEIANRLKKEKVPGFVTMMAYRPYRGVPGVKLPDNLIVMVAERGAWGLYNPEGQKRDLKEIADWTKKLNFKVWLWTYLCKFGATGFTGVPSPSPRAVGRYLKQVTPYITGAYLESETDRYINNYLVYYVHSKYSWDNSLDPDALIAEHHKLMFGKAAGEMSKLFDFFETVWLKEIVGRQVETDLGPAVVPPSDHDLWHKIYTPARIKMLKETFDRAEKLTASNKASLARVKLFRREWLDALTGAREKYMDLTDAVGKFSCSLKSPAWLRPFQSKSPITRPPVQTVVSVAETPEEFVFTYDCEEPMPEAQIAAERKRDDGEMWRDSGVELFLNPSGDRKNFYQIILNIRGGLFDQKLVLKGAKASGDKRWDSGAKTAVAPTPKGYKAVIRVPKSVLGKYDPKGFPVNFSRNRILSSGGPGHATLYTWSPFLRGFHDLENYGVLKLGEVKKAENLIDNGDFSAPVKGRFFGKWCVEANLKQGVKWELDRTEFFTAPPSLKITCTPEARPADMYAAQYLRNLKPNTTYRLSAYIRFKDVKPVKKGGGINFNFVDTANRWFPTNFLTGESLKWSRQSFVFTTPADTNKAKYHNGRTVTPYIRPRILSATGTVWFDDITLEEVKSK